MQLKLILLFKSFLILLSLHRAEGGTNCFWTPEVDTLQQPFAVSPELSQQVLSIAESFRSKYLLPSLAVSVSVGGRLVFSAGLGLRDGVAGPNVSGSSIYRIGSLSKIFTTLLALQMIDAGEIPSLDAPILSLEPLFAIDGTSARYRNASITLRQLSSHTAGLPREGPCFPVDLPSRIACNLPSAEIYRRLRAELMIFDTDASPSYSNLGFAALGNALGTRLLQLHPQNATRCAGHQPELCAFVLAVVDRVLAPLALDADAGFWLTPEAHQRMAAGFSDGLPIPWFDMGWLSPAGQMYSSSDALCRLVSGVLGWGAEGQRVLSATTAAEWMMQRFSNVDGATGMANPWEMRLTGTTPAYWLREKDGEVPGYNSQILVSPELQLVVSVLTAAAPPTVADPLGNQIAEPIVQAVDAWRRAQDPVYPMPEEPGVFEGVYRYFLGERVAEITVQLINTTQGQVFQIKGGPIDGYIHVLDSHMALKPSNGTVSDVQSTYFQLIPLRSSQGDYCPYVQDGYFYQTVQITSDFKMMIPGLYYGFSFHKIK